MPFNIITDYFNCPWFYLDRMNGQNNKICGHKASESCYCKEENCPIKHKDVRKYVKYEFCKAVHCHKYNPKNKFVEGSCLLFINERCLHTAKEFHEWLKGSGFEIVRHQV